MIKFSEEYFRQMETPKFTLTIYAGNAAFEGDDLGEIARILRVTEGRLKSGDVSGTLQDRNGNTVGEFLFE